MKLSKWILGAAILFSAQIASVQGRNSCEPCVMENPCDFCNIDFCDIEYGAYVDALYWKVAKGDLNLGRNSEGTEKYFSPQYSWGYRVGGVARWKNWDLGVRWTSVDSSSHGKYAFTTEKKPKFSFEYRVLDVEAGYTCCMPCGPFSFRPFMGAKSAWIKDHFNKHSGGQSNSKIQYEGYGLYIGSSARWELCSYSTCDINIPIALVARASAGVLYSEFSQKVRDPDFIEINDGRRNLDWEHIYTSYNDVYVALDFSYRDLCGFDSFFQIGYEAQNFGWREYNSDEAVTISGIGGLVLRFGAEY